MERLLVIRFSSLGDVVLLSALLEALRRASPHAEVWLATKELYAPLYRGDPRIDRLVTLPGGAGLTPLRALAAQLDAVEFTRVIDAHNTLRSRVLTWMLPPAPVARLPKDTAARLLFVRTHVRTRPLRHHMVDRYLSLLPTPPALAWRPSIYLNTGDRLDAARLCPLPAPVLAVAPGARHAPKRWPARDYGAVVARFQRAGLGSVLLLGGPGEEEACTEVARALPQPPVVVCGDVGLRATAALLAGARLLLCNDSGLLHLAEAAGTPVLALFGPTVRAFGYFPLLPGSRVLERDLDCRPCSRNGRRPCWRGDLACLAEIAPDAVLAALRPLPPRIDADAPGVRHG